MVVVVAAAVEAVVAVQIASRQSAHFGVNGERRTKFAKLCKARRDHRSLKITNH